MFTAALATDVDLGTRSKGLHYYRAGAVARLGGGDWLAQAMVRGSREYRVEITRAREGMFTGTCECPFFVDRSEVCKHIWATLLAAERRGLLRGEGTSPRELWLEPGGLFDDRADGDDRAAGPPVWERFLSDVRAAQITHEAEPDELRYADGNIIYTIDVAGSAEGRAVLTPQVRQRRKNGEWNKPKTLAMSAHEVERLADADDREIFALLFGAADPLVHLGPHYDAGVARPSRFRLNATLAARVLPQVARTGRAYLSRSSTDGALLPLSWDDGLPWSFDLSIAPQPDAGTFRIDGAFVRGRERMTLKEPVLVLRDGFLFTRTKVARVDLLGAFTWLTHLRKSGPVDVPRAEAAGLVEALARSDVAPASLPEELRYDLVDVAPRPVVHVTRPKHDYRYVARPDLQASVEFEYGGTLVDPASGGAVFDVERSRLIRRDRRAEQAAVDRLFQLGFRKVWDYIGARQGLGVSAEQFPRIVGTLVREGWRVQADGRAFRSVESTEMRVTSGIDWFELRGTVDFGDGLSAPVPQLLAALQRGEDAIILGDGTTGLLPEEWLRRYAGIARFGDATGDHYRFRANQAALLDALLADQPSIEYDTAFERIRRELHAFEGIAPADPPASFRGQLRGYQRDALGWFEFLRRFGFGGCLADDMGLGKTVMVLALLESRRRERKRGEPRTSLVVVPRSLVFNWVEEARRFAPELRVLDYTGPARDAAAVADDVDLVLTTYGTLRRDAAQLKDIEFDYVILDEAQAIKNATTASAKGARLLRGRHRLALSGTPVENHLGELWSLLEFLNPGLLGSSSAFHKRVGKAPDPDDLAWLSRALRPFFLRRTKEQVAPELPPRIEQTIHCELEGVQRRHYDELRTHYRRTLLAHIAETGINRSKIQILEALLRLRQAACHSGLIDKDRGDEPSAKFDLLLPRLREVIGEGHKALVFSQFTSLLALLKPLLDAEGIVYEYLDGATRDRAARVGRFQSDPACPVFLISLKAGGQGLNLTAADYVFLLDPWWNPAVEAQAIDRAHRIGQARHVFAYRLIASDTVEEKVLELQSSKRALADAIVRADASLVRTLDIADLELLLS
jgi:superfamily II DNA or RNA helicase